MYSETSFRSLDSESPSYRPIPKISDNEREDGRILGVGEFCVVREVTQIHLLSRYAAKDADEEQVRQFMGANFKRGDEGFQLRYAVKKLRCDVVEEYYQGKNKNDCIQKSTSNKYKNSKTMYDLDVLGTEVEILQQVQHPNIIKLRAVANTKHTRDPKFCVIIDRLSEILQTRIYDTWAHQLKKYSGKNKKLSWFVSKKAKKETAMIRRDFLVERLLVAYDLASALRYLHYKKIIYRDLKPENIGFDVRGDLKVFDLGLSRKLPDEQENDFNSDVPNHKHLQHHVSVNDDLYQMTPMVGTLRYMAPEVLRGKKYGLSSDVYAFGILLWEILSCTRPFQSMGRIMHYDEVIMNGVRPSLDILISEEVPDAILALLQECWNEDPLSRCTFRCIAPILQDEVMVLRNAYTNNDQIQRSEFMLNRSANSLVNI